MSSSTKTPIRKSIERAETASLVRMERLLSGAGDASIIRLTVGDESVEIPDAAVSLLRDYVNLKRRGMETMLVANEKALSTQEAADILNVSRPYAVRLIEEGEVPHTKVGNRRRVLLRDVMAYKAIRDSERRLALNKLARLEHESGMSALEMEPDI